MSTDKANSAVPWLWKKKIEFAVNAYVIEAVRFTPNTIDSIRLITRCKIKCARIAILLVSLNSRLASVVFLLKNIL